jgi:hypothetical protein
MACALGWEVRLQIYDATGRAVRVEQGTVAIM